jgi:hypothetical protein
MKKGRAAETIQKQLNRENITHIHNHPIKMGGDEIPGSSGPPLIGHTLKFGSDPIGFAEGHRAKYGPLFKMCVLRERGVAVVGHAEATQLLGDAAAPHYCAAKTMVRMARDMYGEGLGLLDGDDYLYARERIGASFGPGTLEMAFPGMCASVDRAVRALLDPSLATTPGISAAPGGAAGVRVVNVYDHFKACAYDIVLLLILGLDPGDPITDEIKKLHSAVWKAATSVRGLKKKKKKKKKNFAPSSEHFGPKKIYIKEKKARARA